MPSRYDYFSEPSGYAQRANAYSSRAGLGYRTRGNFSAFRSERATSSTQTEQGFNTLTREEMLAKYPTSNGTTEQKFVKEGEQPSSEIGSETTVPANEVTETPFLSESGTEALEGAEILGDTAEVAEAASTSFAGPLAIGAIVGQQFGEGINTLMSNRAQANITTQYINNSNHSSGLGSAEQANMIRDYYSQQQNRVDAGGRIGSFFGPLGTLIGRSIGGASNTPLTVSQMDTAYSNLGKIDPQSDNVSMTLSASSIDPSEINNYQQQTASSMQNDISDPNE